MIQHGIYHKEYVDFVYRETFKVLSTSFVQHCRDFLHKRNPKLSNRYILNGDD